MSSAGWWAVARLQALRCARWPVLALVLLVAWWAHAAFDRAGVPQAGAPAVPLEADMLARHGAWWLVLVALPPTFAWLAAGAAHDALGRERPLLLAAGASPLVVLGATASGIAAAGVLALALATAAVESGARVEGVAARSHDVAPAPSGRWIDERYGTAPTWMYIMMGLGLAAAFRDLFRLVRRTKLDQMDDPS